MPSYTSSESRVTSGRVEYYCKYGLLSEYYKELLYGMFQMQKQVINVFVMEKSRLEEELRATKSKMKLYDRLYFIMVGSFSVVCVGFAMRIGVMFVMLGSLLMFDVCNG
ncbi:hypothetical protein Tco_0121346 [Tanacetum coccineum]